MTQYMLIETACPDAAPGSLHALEHIQSTSLLEFIIMSNIDSLFIWMTELIIWET